MTTPPKIPNLPEHVLLEAIIFKHLKEGTTPNIPIFPEYLKLKKSKRKTKRITDANEMYQASSDKVTIPICQTRKNIKMVDPQLPDSKRPLVWKDSPSGYSFNLDKDVYGCNLCDYTHAKAHSVQQHCKKHFPGEYSCTNCKDRFHLKTDFQGHLMVKCLCGKYVRKGSIQGHINKCSELSKLKKETWEIGWATSSKDSQPYIKYK